MSAPSIVPLGHGTSILRDKFGKALELLIASVSLLLLMVCANLAGLLVARNEEIALRLALSVTCSLVRQMLTKARFWPRRGRLRAC
jgi:hypothetical protein